MNKAMMFPIHKKWVDKIFKGEKKFEFRNKLPKHLKSGMKIYFYETKGKVVTKAYTMGPYATDMETSEEHYVGTRVMPPIHEGLGMIVGEATIKDIWHISPGHYKHKGIFHIEFDNYTTSSYMINENEMKEIGYTNQNYAIELTNVIKYDKKWKLHAIENPIAKVINPKKLTNYEKQILNSPTEPIAKEEFVLWNKLDKELSRLQRLNLDWSRGDLEKEVIHNKIIGMDYRGKWSTLKITHPPQAPVYVVERDVK